MRDTPAGPALAEAPPYRPTDPRALTPRWHEPDRHEAAIVVHVLGWPQDVARALGSLARHSAGVDYQVLLVADGAGEATGRALEEIARADPVPGRVQVLHLDPPIGFGAAMNLAMSQATGRVLVWLDPHVEATGDLLRPLLDALADPTVAVAGGWGVVTRSMLEFHAADGPEVDAIEGYLLAVPRALAARAEVDPKARYYRNADLGYSFALRDLGQPSGRPLRAVRVPLPARRHTHRAWHETPQTERDRSSKKNYDRFLARWRQRTDLLTKGSAATTGTTSGTSRARNLGGSPSV